MSERREGAIPSLTNEQRDDCYGRPPGGVIHTHASPPPAAPPGLDEAAMLAAITTALGEGADYRDGYAETRAERVLIMLRPLLAEREAEAWRPIATAPMDGTDVLTFSQGQYVIAYYDWIHRWSPSKGGDYPTYEPTHWRALPPPPAQGG